jgi:hypothetical protein
MIGVAGRKYAAHFVSGSVQNRAHVVRSEARVVREQQRGHASSVRRGGGGALKIGHVTRGPVACGAVEIRARDGKTWCAHEGLRC